MSIEILRFSASWCGPCKSLAKTLEGLDLGAPVTTVDIDANVDKAREYGVRGVPTLIYLKDGKEVSRLVGSKTADELLNWTNEMQK